MLHEKRKQALAIASGALAATSVGATSVMAAGEDTTTALTLSNYDTELKETFKDTADKIGSMILGVIASVMVLIALKTAFKAGVSFFKSAATK